MNRINGNPLAFMPWVFVFAAFVLWLPVWPAREFVLGLLPGRWASMAVLAIPPLVIIMLILLGLRAARRGGRSRSRLFDLAVLVLVIEGGAFFAREAFSVIEDRKCAATAGDIGAFNDALDNYRTDVAARQFPTGTLSKLFSDDAPGWSGPYMATITPDPWNNAYTYTSDGNDYTIQSIHERQGYYPTAETIRYVFSDGKMEGIQR